MEAMWRQLGACGLVLGLTMCLAACSNNGAGTPARGPEANARGQLVYGGVTFSPCALNSANSQSVEAHCARFPVAENPADPNARTLSLALALIPAAGLAEADPVFMLAGGPGQSALESYPDIHTAFGDILRNRHVLLLDARGTGSSNPLHCDLDNSDESTDESIDESTDKSTDALLSSTSSQTRVTAQMVAECRETLSEHADLRFYTTTEHIQDLEQVRVALGVEQLNLVGVSYGTRVAQQYARTYPANTRALILDSVVPNTLVLGQEHARNLEQALDAQFERCRQETSCETLLGDPRQHLAQVREKLRARPPEPVRYRDPVSGEWREEVPHFDHLALLLRLYAYQPSLAASLPLLLHDAAQGQYESLLAQSRIITQELGQTLSMGMSLSVTCSEDAPAFRVDPRDEGTVLGTEFVTQTLTMCAEWPRGTQPENFRQALAGNLPVLAISGEFDPVTPPRYGDSVVATLTNGRHLVLPGQGHSVLAIGCMPRLAAQFLENTNAEELDASCLERLIETPPFTGRYGWEP